MASYAQDYYDYMVSSISLMEKHKITQEIIFSCHVDILYDKIYINIHTTTEVVTCMNGLIVSWFYPPATSAEALVTFKLLKNSAYRYDVISADSRLWSYNSDTVLKSGNIHTYPVESTNFKTFINGGFSLFCKLSGEKTYDFMMTRSMPQQSHSLGLKIKRKNPRLFWVASLADPIGHNPYDFDRYFKQDAAFILKHLPLTVFRIFIYLRNELFERKIIRDADLLIFPSMEQCRFTCAERYEKVKDRVLILPHSYDRDFSAPVKVNKKAEVHGKIVLSHLGHLNDKRSAEGLIKAVSILQKERPELYEKLNIRLVGNIPEKQKQLIQDMGLSNIITEKPVNYFESLKIMDSSDMLILIDAEFGFMKNNIFFASKLADYMGAGKPILGLTTLEGPSASILKAAGCPTCFPDDPRDICEILKSVIENGPPQFMPEVYNAYDAKVIAKKFDETIDRFLNGKKRSVPDKSNW
jgi:hypothetical protein